MTTQKTGDQYVQQARDFLAAERNPGTIAAAAGALTMAKELFMAEGRHEKALGLDSMRLNLLGNRLASELFAAKRSV
jgi:hypothetical protein